jgi:hypothetical protein
LGFAPVRSIASASSDREAFVAVFAVLPENLQRATSALPQKSSLAVNWVPQKTAARFAVVRCSSLFLILIKIA